MGNSPQLKLQTNMAGAVGLEPTTYGFGIRRSANWNYTPIFNTQDRDIHQQFRNHCSLQT
jgi:hypothetical protein